MWIGFSVNKMCSSRKYPYLPPQKVNGNSKGVGVAIAKDILVVFKGKYRAKLEFLQGWGCKLKNVHWGRGGGNNGCFLEPHNVHYGVTCLDECRLGSAEVSGLGVTSASQVPVHRRILHLFDAADLQFSLLSVLFFRKPRFKEGQEWGTVLSGSMSTVFWRGTCGLVLADVIFTFLLSFNHFILYNSLTLTHVT